MHCVDLGQSFPTRIYLQKSASIQPRTSPSKFGREIQFNIHFTPRCLVYCVGNNVIVAETARLAVPASITTLIAASAALAVLQHALKDSVYAYVSLFGIFAFFASCALVLVSGLVERFDIEPFPDFQLDEQTLQGSFSSVSTPNFASKYSLESS